MSEEAFEPRAVLVSLSRALAERDRVRGELFFIRPPERHTRSTIYFVGDSQASSLGCQWVIKQPNEASVQEDLASPRAAETQLRSLVRLAAHFAAVAPVLRVPRPVGLLPEVAAFAMEYVPGRDVNQLIARALFDRGRLFAAIASSARFIKHLHLIDGVGHETAELAKTAQQPLELAEGPMHRLGMELPEEVTATLEAVGNRKIETSSCRLHGDFAPVNMIVDATGHLTGIDASLDEVGAPEEDLARFLTMLATERLFVLGQDMRVVKRVRHRAESTVLETYYGNPAPPLLLELRRIEYLSRRWIHRHVLRARGRPSLAAGRRWAVDRYFRELLLDRARNIQRSL